ncbi:MAG: hypothetical protein ACFCUL_03845, partial [Flavobacteriaceae bacterium]
LLLKLGARHKIFEYWKLLSSMHFYRMKVNIRVEIAKCGNPLGILISPKKTFLRYNWANSGVD